MPKEIRYEVAGRVATVTLDDAERRNALSPAMIEGLADALERARLDEGVSCIVLASSHEKVWCAGGDLSTLTADAPLVHKHFDADAMVSVLRSLLEMPKPTLCAANGHVLAGGLGLALCCDLLIAKDTATFGTPEINIGAFPFIIMAPIFRNVSRKRANELLLLGNRLSAQEALAAGIANRVVPAEEFDAAVQEWAVQLAAKSPVLMRLGKEAMRRQLDMPLEDALDYLRAQLTLAQSTDDIREGVSAFFEKRQPVWTGR